MECLLENLPHLSVVTASESVLISIQVPGLGSGAPLLYILSERENRSQGKCLLVSKKEQGWVSEALAIPRKESLVSHKVKW